MRREEEERRRESEREQVLLVGEMVKEEVGREEERREGMKRGACSVTHYLILFSVNQTGHAECKNFWTPAPVEKLQRHKKKVKKAAAGVFHSLFLTGLYDMQGRWRGCEREDRGCGEEQRVGD